MIFASTFSWRGFLFLVNDQGKVFRVETHGKEDPAFWTMEEVFDLTGGLL